MHIVQRNAVYLRMIIKRLLEKREILIHKKQERDKERNTFYVDFHPDSLEQMGDLIDDLETLIKKYEEEDDSRYDEPFINPEDIYSI